MGELVDTRWLIRLPTGDIGPFETAAVWKLIDAGTINSLTPIRPANDRTWREAGMVPELTRMFPQPQLLILGEHSKNTAKDRNPTAYIMPMLVTVAVIFAVIVGVIMGIYYGGVAAGVLWTALWLGGEAFSIVMIYLIVFAARSAWKHGGRD